VVPTSVGITPEVPDEMLVDQHCKIELILLLPLDSERIPT
jgi:hypothetical protein